MLIFFLFSTQLYVRKMFSYYKLNDLCHIRNGLCILEPSTSMHYLYLLEEPVIMHPFFPACYVSSTLSIIFNNLFILSFYIWTYCGLHITFSDSLILQCKFFRQFFFFIIKFDLKDIIFKTSINMEYIYDCNICSIVKICLFQHCLM